MKCPFCGGEHPDQARFCPVTGQALPKTAAVCPQCQHEMPTGARFCPFCGYKEEEKNRNISKQGFMKILIVVGLVFILIGSVLVFREELQEMPLFGFNREKSVLPALGSDQEEKLTLQPDDQFGEIFGGEPFAEVPEQGARNTPKVTAILHKTPTSTQFTLEPTATYTKTPTMKRTALPSPTITPLMNIPANMVLIPGGTFSMGATEDEMEWHLNSCNYYASCSQVDFVDMMPKHKVQLSPYLVDVHEVTNAEYRACVEAGVCGAPNSGAISRYLAKDYYNNRTYDQYPVVAVSWNNAVNYCNWAGGKRLPSEAEWERAAKGNEDYFFPWTRRPVGSSAESVFGSKTPLANFCDQDCPMQNWNDSRLNDGWVGPAPVMSFAPGPFGLYDMSGNVTEWIQDYYGANYYSYSLLEDPVNKTWSEWRVTRGGGWNNGIYHLTSMFRSAQSPNNAKAFIGFRCVMDYE